MTLTKSCNLQETYPVTMMHVLNIVAESNRCKVKKKKISRGGGRTVFQDSYHPCQSTFKETLSTYFLVVSNILFSLSKTESSVCLNLCQISIPF